MEQAIKDKAPKPAGLVPKNLQAFLLVGLALLMVLVMALTGHKRPAPPTNPQTSPVAEHPARECRQSYRFSENN